MSMRLSKMERIIAMLEKEGYTQRRIKNRLAKEEEKENIEKNQKEVEKIVITIEWKRSPTWGYNPACEATIQYKDGSYARSETFRCSGCGYDKESTVIAQVFNEYLRYTLWNKENEVLDKKDIPYGVHLDYDYSPRFDGGIGTDCYHRIAGFIGGKFSRISSGKLFDVYQFEMNDTN